MQYAKIQGYKKEEFYREIGIDGANFRGKNALSDLGSEKIVSILTNFPDLNPDWLLLGKGEMLRQQDPAPAPSTAPNDFLLQLLAEKDNRIEALVRENERLQLQLESERKKSASMSALIQSS